MIATAIVVFRELFEISLMLSIIVAATKNLPQQKKVISLGVVTGIITSFIIALLLNRITNMFNGYGQEIINLLILITSITLISYTLTWMKKNTNKLNHKLKITEQKVKVGQKTLYAISLIVATSIIREGSEIILFLSGIYATGIELSNFIIGTAIGTIIGSAVGIFIYKGILRFNFKYVFNITSWTLILLAASMASEAANNLQAMDLITFLSEPLWDTSWILSSQSILGNILHTILGYDPQPNGLQLSFYLITLFTLYSAIRLANNNKQNEHS